LERSREDNSARRLAFAAIESFEEGWPEFVESRPNCRSISATFKRSPAITSAWPAITSAWAATSARSSAITPAWTATSAAKSSYDGCCDTKINLPDRQTTHRRHLRLPKPTTP
jgi:hypothetical protein